MAVVFLDELLTEMIEEATEVRVWPDGPARQFKNKYVMSAIQPLSEIMGKRSFGTSAQQAMGRDQLKESEQPLKNTLKIKNFTAGANLYECIIRLNALLESENVRQL